MREILFRGKRISSGEWVEGGIMQTFHPNYNSENTEDFIMRKPNCYCICANNKDYFVEQNTIGQYTGLKDKNGKKIFEGDIVEHEYRGAKEVKYCGGFFFPFVAFPEYKCMCADDCKVIGNIHDNPELLK